jgi:biopolymer transport protein ExbB/TolQ
MAAENKKENKMSFILMAQAEQPQAEQLQAEPAPAESTLVPDAEQAPDSPEAADQALDGASPETHYSGLAPAAAGALAPPPGQLTAGVGLPSAPPREMSVKHMFLNADPVVRMVMLLLFLASVATWVVIFEKAQTLRRAGQQILRFKLAASWRDGLIRAGDFPELTQPIVTAGLEESGHPAEDETKSEYRERIERSMRAELSGLMDRLGHRTMFLASVGSVSPFVGLFGTVWGIMHSFIGIAASGETTLAVVAPGIAEALFATAMGLVAAIPAVVAYNKINGTLKQISKEALAGIGRLGNRLARLNYKKAQGA